MPKFALNEVERAALLGFLRGIAGGDLVEERAARPLDRSETARAAGLFAQHGCGACHLPTEDAMHRWTLKAPLVSTMANRLRRDWAVDWIADPQAAHPGTAMPTFPLTRPERELLVDYLLSRPQELVDREASYRPGASAPPHR